MKKLVIVLLANIICLRAEAYEKTKNYGVKGVAAVLVRDNDTSVAMKCLTPLAEVSEKVPPLPYHMQPSYLELYNCTSYLPFKILLAPLNIEATNTLNIWASAEPPLSAVNFKELSIKSLKLDVPRETEGVKLEPESDFLEPLNALTVLEVSNIVLPPLPARTVVRKVLLKSGSSSGEYGGCSHLQELDVEDWETPIFTNWLKRCQKLEKMRLKSLSPATIRRLIDGTTSLRSLTIRSSDLQCTVNKINPACYRLFSSLTKLEHLDLTSNGIQRIHEHFFENLTSLVELNLSDNMIKESWDVLGSIARLDKLTTLTLAHNNFEQWCTFFYSNLRLPKNLSRLSLSNTGITEICAQQMTSRTSLEFLDMTNNGIKVLMFKDLPFATRSKSFIIDLRNNDVREFIMTKEDYKNLQRYQTVLTVTLEQTEIKCDCEHRWLALALRQFPTLRVEGLHCDGGTTLEKIDISTVNCVKRYCSGCLCRYWRNGETHANCSGVAQAEIPHEKNLTTLNMHQSGIQTLIADDLPFSLKNVDLSNNRLSHMDERVADVLFSNKDRVIRLAENPIACDCNNSHFINLIQKRSKQVKDYKDVRCADNQRIDKVVVGDLCNLETRQTILTAALTVSGAFAFLVTVALGLSHRYRHELRVFLHARGWCSFLFYEADEDRPYDVFLSYSHEDQELVSEQILPKLENGAREYSVCIHYRDWIAGEWIPMQIARSVQLSRRTLIIVSSSFLDSMWGLLEFRTAMMCSAREGHSRIVLVLLDENLISDARVDPELRTYLNANTYLCWDDPWFWDKLYYALPHRNREVDGNPMDPETMTSSIVNISDLHNLLPLRNRN